MLRTVQGLLQDHVHSILSLACYYNLQTKHDMKMKPIHLSTYLTESQNALEAHGYKPWVTNLSIIPLTLCILTAKHYLMYNTT